MIQVNISAEPMQRSSHNAPTPTAGGLAFISVFWITHFAHLLLSPSCPDNFLYRFLPVYGFASLILAVISLKDDYKPLSYRFRLFIHLICVTLIVSQGLQIQFPAFGLETNGWLAAIITGFCLISLINGANFVDGLNGLLAGCFLIALVFNVLIILPAHPSVTFFYISLFFSVLGFLLFNFPRARIFMGDIGSTFLGLTVGFSALILQFYYPLTTDTAWVHKGFIYALTPLGFLWFDVGFTLLRRAILRYRLTEPHRDHLIHILNDCDYSHTFVSCLYFFLTAFMGGLTLLSHYGYITFLSFFLIYALTQILFCFWVFHQKQHRHKSKST
ncbi:MAG: hypothetical protein K2Q34_00020 [Alphaproteobacteria bacterium]|nr:hypothetical protein [Alphaproteobacteria bacterium]